MQEQPKSVLKQPDFVSRGIDHQEKAKETDNRKAIYQKLVVEP